jgi:hypothetical protein
VSSATEHALLRQFLLEESYVLDFELHPGSATFSVDFALAPSHPEFVPAPPTDAFAFRQGLLVFSGVRRCTWVAGNARPTVDPDGTLDWDSFHSITWEGDNWRVVGDFGDVTLNVTSLDVLLNEKSS